MKTLYTTTVNVSGGREGHAKSTDNRLEVTLQPPKELGGPASGTGTNPEQLFAAGYSACFESAIRHVARGKKISITKSAVAGEVQLKSKDDGGFSLEVTLTVELPELDHAKAEDLVKAAHQVCPYSNATRGNIPVNLIVK